VTSRVTGLAVMLRHASWWAEQGGVGHRCVVLSTLFLFGLYSARARRVVTAGVAAALALAAAVAAGEEADEDANEADDAVDDGGDDAADAADNGHDGAAYSAEGVTNLLRRGC